MVGDEPPLTTVIASRRRSNLTVRMGVGGDCFVAYAPRKDRRGSVLAKTEEGALLVKTRRGSVTESGRGSRGEGKGKGSDFGRSPLGF